MKLAGACIKDDTCAKLVAIAIKENRTLAGQCRHLFDNCIRDHETQPTESWADQPIHGEIIKLGLDMPEAPKAKSVLHQLPDEKFPAGYSGYDPETLGAYDIERLENSVSEPTDFWYYYGTGCYCGAGYMIGRNSSGWGYHDMGHCSCYGPVEEGGFDFRYASLEALLESCTQELRKHLQPLVEMIQNP